MNNLNCFVHRDLYDYSGARVPRHLFAIVLSFLIFFLGRYPDTVHGGVGM